MRPTLLLAALAAGAVNAYERHVYVTDWTTVTVTKTVTAPTVTETVPAANQVQVDYKTTTVSAAAVETEHSELLKKSTVIVPQSVTSSTSTFTPAPAPTTSAAEVVQAPAESTSYWSTAWTSTIEPESTISATSTLATSTSSAAAATTTAANAYQQAVLYNHNIHRSNHSVPSVDWSADLETSALALAAKCVYEHDT